MKPTLLHQTAMLFGAFVVFLTPAKSEAVTESSASPVVVINKGIGGQTAVDGLKRFEKDVASLHPKHLILYFGINDSCNKNIPLNEFEEALSQMVTRAQASGIETVVLMTPHPIISEYVVARHPDHPEAADLQAHLDTYGEVVRRIAKKYGLPLADLNRLVKEHGGASKEASSLIRNEANAKSRDGIHFTPEGYRGMASLCATLLKDKIKPGDVIVCLGDSLTYGANVQGAGTSDGETYPAQLKKLLNGLLKQ
jgi:lysophospholipase L1-like esterase